MTAYTGHPVRPAWEGGLVQSDGAVFTAGWARDPIAEATAAILRTGEPVGTDLESCGLTGVSPYLVKVVTFATRGRALALDPRLDWQRATILFLLQHAPWLVFHGSAYDVPILGALGLFRPEWCARVVDTMVYARQAEPGSQKRKRLADCAQRYLGAAPDSGKGRAARSKGETLVEFYDATDIDSPAYLRDAMRDAITTARLLEPVRDAVWTRITDNRFIGHGAVTDPAEAAEVLDRQQKVNRVFLRASLRPLKGDPEYLDNYRRDHDREIDQAANRLSDEGLRPGNGNDLAAHLLHLGALPPRYPWTKGGKHTKPRPSTNKDHLERVVHPLVSAHRTYAELVHVRDHYLGKAAAALSVAGTVRTLLPWSGMVDGIRPNANVLGADATGRMSYSGDFPVHQLPEAARGMIVFDAPRSGIDWAQIEPVIAANVAGDHAMLERYERGEEKLYDSIARASGQSYKTAKTIILAAMYAEGLESSAGKLGITYKAAEELRAKVFGPLPRTRQLLRALKLGANESGQTITTGGRVLDIEWYPAKDGREAGYAGYKAQNYYVQGSAYDELADTVVEIDERGYGDAVDIAMHDELIVLTEAADDIARIMSRPSRRLCLWSGRTPVLRTDRDDMGLRWRATA